MGYGKVDPAELKKAEVAAQSAPRHRPRPAEPRKDHPLLDLTKVRTSTVTDEHPNPRAIFIGLDVTGSTEQAHHEMMTGGTTRLLQLLLSLGVLGDFDPQVLFAGLADLYDTVGALQVGHFESDNRMYKQLGQITVGGGGGPYDHHEAGYLYAIFFLAFLTVPECFTKLGQKGHAIIVGDEFPHSTISRQEAKMFGVSIEHTMTFAEVVAKVKEMYHLTFISLQTETGRPQYMVPGTSFRQTTSERWRSLIGSDSVIETDANGTGLAQIMAIQIGIKEGLMTAEAAVSHLIDIGVDKPTVLAVAKTFGVPTQGLFPEDEHTRNRGGFYRD